MSLHPVIIQAIYYAVVICLATALVAVLLKGFFWKYVKVRLSFGKLVLVKLRGRIIDHFAVGWIENSQLVYKKKKVKGPSIEVRINLQDNKAFYRTLSVNWIDVDEVKGAICNVDYTPVSGHDTEKESNLYTRALTQPEIGFTKEKIIILLVIIAIVGTIAATYLAYANSQTMISLQGQIANYASQAKGTVVGSSSSI